MLRHAAGLNDTLIDMINMVAIADMEPTAQVDAVSRETMTCVALDRRRQAAREIDGLHREMVQPLAGRRRRIAGSAVLVAIVAGVAAVSLDVIAARRSRQR